MQENEISQDRWRNWLSRGASALGIDLNEAQIELLYVFARELLAANRTLNLTRITDPLQIAENLMLDSMVPGKYIPAGARVLDLGTGAGFPGIPLKVAFPDLLLTLVDSKRKKINFLKYIIRFLQLNDISALHARAESLEKSDYRFDVVVSRAVSSVRHLFQIAAPAMLPGGTLIAMKGRGVHSELNSDMAIDFESVPGYALEFKHYQLPALKIDRVLVILRLEN